MITPAYSLTATERVLPKLALDFTTASLDSRVTFTRATGASNPATYVNSSGYIIEATNNQPRFDYDSVTLACKGLLIEESRTNYAKYSNAFNNNTLATWNIPGISTPTPNSGTSPDGTNNSYLIKATAGASVHGVYSTSVGIASGATATLSIYIKAGTHSLFQLSVSNSAASGYVNFDLSTQTVSATTATGTITPAGNSWYRCTLTGVISGTTAGFQLVMVNSLSDTRYQSWTAAGTETMYLFGAQLEAGAFATSYIPTTSAALTRNADVATMTGTNFSDWYNQSEGSFEFQALCSSGVGSTQYAFTASDGTASNMINMYRGTTGNMGSAVYTSGVSQHDNNTGVLQSNLSFVNGALGLKVNSSYRAYNATAGTSSSVTVNSMPTLNQFQIGNRTDLTRAWNGHIRKIEYWPQRLINNEIFSFSK